MFGGKDSLSSSLIPSDIEIENNYFFKPLSLIGSGLNAKNMLEFKDAKRVLVTGNTFVNNPAAAQPGFALLITPRNQGGHAPWSTTQDISIVGNTFINVGNGMVIAGFDHDYPSYPTTNPGVMTKRILVRNNLLEVTGLGGADGRSFQFGNGGSDYTIDHNTIINTAPGPSDIAMVASMPFPITNFVFTNNLFTHTRYGFFGSSVGGGTVALNTYFSQWTFQKNALTGEEQSRYPAGNFFPASISDVSFSDYTQGNFSLAASSPYKNAGTDGDDIGADMPLTDAIVPGPPVSVAVN